MDGYRYRHDLKLSLFFPSVHFTQNGQPQKNQGHSDPPQIYLTSVSDPSSLTSLIQVASNDCVVSSQQGHPVFVVIKPPPVGETKEPNLTSGEDLLDIVDLDVKPEDEVRIKAECSRVPEPNCLYLVQPAHLDKQCALVILS